MLKYQAEALPFLAVVNQISILFPFVGGLLPCPIYIIVAIWWRVSTYFANFFRHFSG
jgi:ABC-type nickel/cobalt efflux system permease component RcnA